MKKLKLVLLTTCISLLFSIQSFAGWVQQANGQWNYDQNGSRATSQWIKDQGNWYYFDASGVMLANTTQDIHGVVYTFDASGKWIDSNASTTITNKTYNNTEFGYSLQIPSDLDTTAFNGNSETFDIDSENLFITFNNTIIPADVDPALYSTLFETGIMNVLKGEVSFIDKTNAQLGEFAVTKTRYLYNNSVNLDCYICTRDHKIFVICTLYTPETEARVQGILNTLKELR